MASSGDGRLDWAWMELLSLMELHAIEYPLREGLGCDGAF